MPYKIRGDLHIHSMHSVCDAHSEGDLVDYDKKCGQGAIRDLLNFMKQLRGLEYIAICNHATNPSKPKKTTKEEDQKLLNHIKAIERLNREKKCPLFLLSGVEANILKNGELDVSQNTLQKLDIVVASLHGDVSKLSQVEIKDRFFGAMQNKEVDVIGHITRYIDNLKFSEWRELVREAQKQKIAIEFNISSPLKPELVYLAAECKNFVSLGSDSHGDDRVKDERVIPRNLCVEECLHLLRDLDRMGVTGDYILNTWPLEKLRKWLKTHRL